MSKRKHKRQRAELFSAITSTVAATVTATRPLADDLFEQKAVERTHAHLPDSDALLTTSKELAHLVMAPEKQSHQLPKMKKFRFQLLHQWMLSNLLPCRVADVGGGKGLLTYLLQKSGWTATVIDPFDQRLPSKYKDIHANKQIQIPSTECVARINQPFTATMANDFDLLIALHAHGCNIQLLNAAAAYGRRLLLLPCCIIQEPLCPPPGVHWIQSVVDYALQKGFIVQPFRLNFKGQNIGLYMHQ